MQENFLITIKGTMEQRGDSDTVELMTRGSLVHKEGAYYIVYKETEATGYEGCTTTVKVAEDARKVSMLRYGKVPSQLIIEEGTRHPLPLTRPATVPPAWVSPPMSSSMN